MEDYKIQLKQSFQSYWPITDQTWLEIERILKFQHLKKGEILLREGQTAKAIHYICKGALRTYFTDKEGSVYNKNLFLEHNFAASKVSLLEDIPSYFTIEALEDTTLLNINFKLYKQLQEQNSDLKNFYIAYIEKNWIISKEQHEISLVMENATVRYQKLLAKYPSLDTRIAQHHIASHLGITPTQLSRIRKELKK